MNAQFTAFGVLTIGAVLWTISQGASPQGRAVIDGLLGVLLASMILLNWGQIGPLFITQVQGTGTGN